MNHLTPPAASPQRPARTHVLLDGAVLLTLSAATLWLYLLRVQDGRLPIRPAHFSISFLYGATGPIWYAAKARGTRAFTLGESAVAIALFPAVGVCLHRIFSASWNASVGAGVAVGFFAALSVASFCGIRFTRKTTNDTK